MYISTEILPGMGEVLVWLLEEVVLADFDDIQVDFEVAVVVDTVGIVDIVQVSVGLVVAYVDSVKTA